MDKRTHGGIRPGAGRQVDPRRGGIEDTLALLSEIAEGVSLAQARLRLVLVSPRREVSVTELRALDARWRAKGSGQVAVTTDLAA